MNVKSSIIINRPIETVFAHISRLEYFKPRIQNDNGEQKTNHKRHHVQFIEIKQASEGPVRVGTTFVQVTSWRGVPSKAMIEISEYEPPYIIACKSGNVPMQVKYTLEPVVGGTKVTETTKFEGLLGLLFALQTKKDAETPLSRLKELVEAQP